jgi:hypothetical protein
VFLCETWDRRVLRSLGDNWGQIYQNVIKGTIGT